MLHLDDDAVRQVLDQHALVDVMETVFRDLGTGDAASTVRVRATTPTAMASAMAAAIPSMGVTGGKVYATVAGRFTFHVVLFDLDGQLIGALDGATLTEARTPALCAVAIRHFAPVSPTVAAVLGTGREALPHLRMLHRELPGAELRLWGRRVDAADALVEECARHGITVDAVATSEAAVADADVVVTVTSADAPIVDSAAIADHALVCAVGATKPQRCELGSDLFARSSAVVTDSIAGAPNECGDLIHAVAAGTIAWEDVADLSAVLAGKVDVQRAGHQGPVVFETQGVAAQDVAAAALVWQHTYPSHPQQRQQQGTPT